MNPEVLKLVKEAAGSDDVLPTSRFDELKIDSLEYVELMQAVEEQFHIQIPDDHMALLNTVAELGQYVENRLADVSG